MKRLALTLILSLFALFGFANAQDAIAFTDVDQDGNTEVVLTEVVTFYEDAGLYDWLDANANEIIDEEEFRNWVFNFLDVDGDNSVSEEEMATGFDLLYDSDYEVTYQDFDGDADAGVTVDEFNTVYDPTDLLASLDVDTNDEVGLDEFPQGIFNIADEDDDGMLSEQEFNDNVTLFEPVPLDE